MQKISVKSILMLISIIYLKCGKGPVEIIIPCLKHTNPYDSIEELNEKVKMFNISPLKDIKIYDDFYDPNLFDKYDTWTYQEKEDKDNYHRKYAFVAYFRNI